MTENDSPRIRRRTVLKTAGAVGASLGLPGVGAADCGATYTSSYGGSLSGFGDSACYYVAYHGGGPCYVDVRLTSDATDADFDLYANAERNNCPSLLFYDYASDTPDEDARITIYDPDPSMDGLSVLVRAESGSGEYTLEIESHL